jgi:hypothetical protein
MSRPTPNIKLLLLLLLLLLLSAPAGHLITMRFS